MKYKIEIIDGKPMYYPVGSRMGKRYAKPVTPDFIAKNRDQISNLGAIQDEFPALRQVVQDSYNVPSSTDADIPAPSKDRATEQNPQGYHHTDPRHFAYPKKVNEEGGTVPVTKDELDNLTDGRGVDGGDLPEDSIELTPEQPPVRTDSPTLDDPAAETSVEEPAPQQNQVSIEEPTNRLAVSQQPALRTDPRVTRPGDITKRNLRRELIADEAAAMRTDMANARRQRRIDDIFDSREADMAESWAKSPTGRRDGRKWSELDPKTKQEMRNRFVDYRQNMATSSMDDPGLRGPRGDQGAPGPAGPGGISTQQITPFMTQEEQNNIIQQDMQLPQTQSVDIVGPPSTAPISDAEKQTAAQSILNSPQPPSNQPRDPSAGLNSLNPKPVMSPTDFVNDTNNAPEFDPSSLPTLTETKPTSIDDLDLRPYQGPQPLAPMQGPNPMSDQDMYDMMDQATAPKAPKGPTQGPSQENFRAQQYIEKEMAKSGPDMKTYERSTTVPNPNYDYSTRNNPAAPLNPNDDPNDKRTYRPNPGGQFVYVPVYGKSGYMGYTEGRDGRFVQAPKGFDQKQHFNAVNLAAFENRKQQQMERQARRGAMKNPFTFVDTNPDSDNFLKEYQYNRARDEKRREYKGTFNPYT